MSTVELNKENFDQIVSDNDIVVVDFWAEWCEPCKAFAEIYEKASEKHPDVVFGSVNVEVEGELVIDFNVRSVPFVMIIRQNIAVFTDAGLIPDNVLVKMIEEVKALDMDEVRKGIESENEDEKKG